MRWQGEGEEVMDIFVKYPDSETLHRYTTGDGEGSDAATFRATVLNGRTDLILTDAAGNVLDAPVAEPVAEPVTKVSTRKAKSKV